MKELRSEQGCKVIVKARRLELPSDATYFALEDEKQVLLVCRRSYSWDKSAGERHIYIDDTNGRRGIRCTIVGWAKNMRAARKVAQAHREISSKRNGSAFLMSVLSCKK